jgi:hypothetical protein
LVAAPKSTRFLEATPDSPSARAATGDTARAADVYASIGARVDEADARLAAGKSLITGGPHRDGDDLLQTALAFYRSVGAMSYVRDGETLLAKSA